MGTFREIGNLFLATLMKSAALMRAAEKNIITRDYVDFVRRESPSMLTEPGKGDFLLRKNKEGNTMRIAKEPADPNLGMIAYLDGGKLQAVYVHKDIAETFNRRPQEAKICYKLVQAVINPYRQLFVRKNVGWAIWNGLWRDPKTAAKKLPGNYLIKQYWNLIKSVPDVYKDVVKNISTPLVRQARTEKALAVGLKYKRSFAYDAETEADYMMAKLGVMDPNQYGNKVVNVWHKIGRTLENVAEISEKLNKVASFRILQKKFPEMSAQRRAWMVRNWGGSPDFWQRGSKYNITNNLFLFSNAGMQDWRGTYWSYVNDARTVMRTVRQKKFGTAFNTARQGILWKTVKYDLIPKSLIAMAATGMFAAIGKALKDPIIEDLGGELEKAYELIPDNDKTNYLCVPLGFTKEGKCVYLVQPHDYMGQVIGGIYWKGIMKDKEMYTRSMTDYIQGGLPYSS